MTFGMVTREEDVPTMNSNIYELCFCSKKISIWACFPTVEELKMFKIVHTIYDPETVKLIDITNGIVKAFSFPYKVCEDILAVYAPEVGHAADGELCTDSLSNDSDLRNHVKRCVVAGYRSIYLFALYYNMVDDSKKVDEVYRERNRAKELLEVYRDENGNLG